MRLLRLIIRRMPGIDRPFELGESEIAEGLTLIVGPNASGKSTICRAVQALLWPGKHRDTPISVEAHWEREGGRLTVTREGQSTHWKRDGQDCSPPDLPAEDISATYSLNQLEVISGGEGSTEEMIVDRIRLQAAGGYSVGELLAEHFQLPPRYASPEKAAFLEASKARERVRLAQGDLGRRVEELAGLRRQQEEASGAQDRVSALGAAKELLAVQHELEDLRQRLAAYPADMSALSGKELEELESARKKAAEFRQQLSELAQEIESVERRIAELSFEGAPLPDRVIETWLAEARNAEQLAQQLPRAREASAGAEKRLAVASEKLGIDPAESWATPEPAQVDEAIALLGEHDEIAASRGFLRKRLALHEGSSSGDENTLQAGIAALEDWLRAPGQARGLPVLLLVSLLLLTGTGLLLAWKLSAYWFVATPFTLLGLAWAIRLVSRAGADLSPAQCESRFRQLGLELPGDWSNDAVRSRLDELRSEAAAGKMDREKERHAQELEVDLEGLDARARELQARREALSAALGIDPELGHGAAARLVSRLRGWQEAKEDAAEASGRQAKLEEELAAAVERIASFVTAHGEAAPASAIEALSGVEDLKDRTLGLRAAMVQLDIRAQGRVGLSRLLEEAEGSIARVFEGAGLEVDDDAELARRSARLDAWREDSAQERTLAQRVSWLGEQIADGPDLLALSPGEVESLLLETKRQAEELGGIVRQIADIEADVRKTEREHDLEEATAEVDRTRRSLVDRRDDALFKIAGRHLLTGVRETHDRRHEPAVMSEARRLFEEFTSHRYELRFDREGQSASFRAIDRKTGQQLALSQLSDGTRSQLLLAVRLAFITHAEQGGPPLPLFLDEVLSATDPLRYQAIATNLLQIIESQGRQVIYLSCDPADEQYWRQAQVERGQEPVTVLDLGTLRDEAEAMPPGAELPRAGETLPAPDACESAEEYARLVKVPRWTLEELPRIHLFYLLRDDLQSLHVLLQARVNTVGMYKGFHAAGRASELLGEEKAAGIAREILVLAAFLEARVIGLGRPVDRFAIEAAGAVSSIFLDQVATLAAACDGDSRALLDALRAKKVPNFHTSKINELEHYLEDNGYLDPRDLLDFDALQLRTLRSLQPLLDAGETTLADLSVRLQYYFDLG